MLGILFFEIVIFMLLLSLRPSNSDSKSENNASGLTPGSTDEISISRNVTPLYHPDASVLRDISEKSDAYVSQYLHKLDPNQYVVLDNLLIPSDHAYPGTTQVDHVVVSTYGIFVIETKGHVGCVYGSKERKTWTQYNNYGAHTGFNSPVYQNYCHKQAVVNILKGWVFQPVNSLCIFPFASKIVAEDCQNIFNLDEALDFIQCKRHRIYSNGEVNRMVDMLLKANKTDDYSYDNHVAKLKLHFAN